jgi:hypothetical protein
MSNFRPTDRRTGFLMPPSVEDWLPQRHLARFVIEVVDGLDLRAMSGAYLCVEERNFDRLAEIAEMKETTFAGMRTKAD